MCLVVFCSALFCSDLLLCYSTVFYCTPLYSTVLHCTPLYSTVLLHCTLLYSVTCCIASARPCAGAFTLSSMAQYSFINSFCFAASVNLPQRKLLAVAMILTSWRQYYNTEVYICIWNVISVPRMHTFYNTHEELNSVKALITRPMTKQCLFNVSRYLLLKRCRLTKHCLPSNPA